MKKFSILFDLDGCLWDSTKTIYKAWNEVLNKETKDKKTNINDIKSLLGLEISQIIDNYFKEIDPARKEEIANKCLENEVILIKKIGGELYDDVFDELITLSKEYDLYIVSNCQKGYIESFLEYYKLNAYFKDIECYGNNQLSKSENIKLIMNRNNINKCCYVGDTQNDYNSAKENNIPFIYAKYGFGKINNCEYSINSFKELKDVIKKIRLKPYFFNDNVFISSSLHKTLISRFISSLFGI